MALEVLGKAIQDAGTDVSNPLGHDSAQDAQIALELALHKFERHLNNPLVDEYIMNNTGIFLGTKCTLFEELAFSIKKQSSTLGICVASADKYDGRNVWEAYSLGYKPDSRPFEVLNKRMSDQTALCNTKHDTSKEAIKAAIDYLQATKRDQKEQSTPSLVWVDIPAEVPDEGMCRELDLSLDELFQASNIGTMMLVVGQGSLEPLRSLLAKKQRAQWDIAQRQSNLKIADTPTVSWDDIDDQNLSLAAASVASGVAFIRSK